MPKIASSFELTLDEPPAQVKLTRWLYDELSRAILSGRLAPGVRLPATRDFAKQYGISRGTVVVVFERLQSEGYMEGRVGAGTWVNTQLPQRPHIQNPAGTAVVARSRSAAFGGHIGPARPFRLDQPANEHFPLKTWIRVAGRQLRALSPRQLAGTDGRGMAALRQAIATYLGSSRGVRCCADQIVVLTGIQQALDLLSRLLLKPGDSVWLEDPGYFGAAMAFRNAGAKIIPVPVDSDGLRISEGRRLALHAKCAYTTPTHQFPLGMAMPVERRLELLAWARESGAFIIEDDYDSEFRFEGSPAPALQSLDPIDKVIFLGTFNKLLFPSLRVGYAVLPTSLIDPFLALRYGCDLRGGGLDQAILCDFIAEGHLGRHLRHMRELYGERLAAILEGERKYLGASLQLTPVRAGLFTTGLLTNGMTSKEAETVAKAANVETLGLHRITLGTTGRPQGLVLGFSTFNKRSILAGAAALGSALERNKPKK